MKIPLSSKHRDRKKRLGISYLHISSASSIQAKRHHNVFQCQRKETKWKKKKNDSAANLLIMYQRSTSITVMHKTKRDYVHLVCSAFGITSKSQCCHNPLQFFHMGGTPWCEVLPSICYSSQIVFCSYQLYEILKSQLEFKFALPSLKAFIIKQADTKFWM